MTNEEHFKMNEERFKISKPITIIDPHGICGNFYLFKDIGWIHKKDLSSRWYKKVGSQLVFVFD